MKNKLMEQNRMNELLIVSELHKFINSLGVMEYTLAAKTLTLGYKPKHFWAASNKFATIMGDKKHRYLILHVEPGNPESTKGKTVQKEIQQLLNFDIREVRNFTSLKKHEVYVPFEVVDSNEKMKLLKAFIKKQFEIFIENKY